MVVDPYKRLDRVSCPDMEIRVLPNLGIALDRVSCPDTDIGVSGMICTTVSRSITFCLDQTVINLGSKLITQNRS